MGRAHEDRLRGRIKTAIHRCRQNKHRSTLRLGSSSFKTTSDAPLLGRSPSLVSGPLRALILECRTWTPDPLGRMVSNADNDRRTRRSSGARWLSWSNTGRSPEELSRSSSRRRRSRNWVVPLHRGASRGWAKHAGATGVASPSPRESSAARRTRYLQPRPGLLGGPYRGGLPVHESESGRVSIATMAGEFSESPRAGTTRGAVSAIGARGL